MIAERTADAPEAPAVAELELGLLVDGVERLTGYDLRPYATAMLRRRVLARAAAEGCGTITALLDRCLHDAAAMSRLVDDCTASSHSALDDPPFFRTLGERVVPHLRTFAHVRVWVAGAVQDAFPVALLLREAGLGERTRIYATETADGAIARADAGIVAGAEGGDDELRRRYAALGLATPFDAALVPGPDGERRWSASLRETIVFARHHLVTDASFNEFHLVVARGLVGLYARPGAYRAHQVLYGSLVRLGFLALDPGETLRMTPHARAYASVPDAPGVYRRLR